MVVLDVKRPSLYQKLARDWLLDKLYLVYFKSYDESKLLMQGVVMSERPLVLIKCAFIIGCAFLSVLIITGFLLRSISLQTNF